MSIRRRFLVIDCVDPPRGQSPTPEGHMRVTRSATLCVALGALVVGALSFGAPAAAGTGPLGATGADALVASLGADRTAGTWLDHSGRMVVAVTDTAAAARVEAVGGIAQLVTRSSLTLEKLRTSMDKGIVGTAWSIDPTKNQVVISVDTTVTGASLSGLSSMAVGSGGAVRIEHLTGK